MTTLDNDDIDISMSHILLFPKIFNLAVCHTIKANQQKSIPCYPTIIHVVLVDNLIIISVVYLIKIINK